jgi:hypothetical protein
MIGAKFELRVGDKTNSAFGYCLHGWPRHVVATFHMYRVGHPLCFNMQYEIKYIVYICYVYLHDIPDTNIWSYWRKEYKTGGARVGQGVPGRPCHFGNGLIVSSFAKWCNLCAWCSMMFCGATRGSWMHTTTKPYTQQPYTGWCLLASLIGCCGQWCPDLPFVFLLMCPSKYRRMQVGSLNDNEDLSNCNGWLLPILSWWPVLRYVCSGSARMSYSNCSHPYLQLCLEWTQLHSLPDPSRHLHVLSITSGWRQGQSLSP